MATTYTTREFDNGSATPQSRLGNNRVYDRYTQTAAFVINDLVRSFYIPKHAVITDCLVSGEDFDTHATPTITLTARITDGTTTKNLFVASTVLQAAVGVQRASITGENAIGYEVTTAGFWFELLIAAAPATGTTDKKLFWWLDYTMNRIPADL